jgi:hypothetical protein
VNATERSTSADVESTPRIGASCVLCCAGQGPDTAALVVSAPTNANSARIMGNQHSGRRLCSMPSPNASVGTVGRCRVLFVVILR